MMVGGMYIVLMLDVPWDFVPRVRRYHGRYVHPLLGNSTRRSSHPWYKVQARLPPFQSLPLSENQHPPIYRYHLPDPTMSTTCNDQLSDESNAGSSAQKMTTFSAAADTTVEQSKEASGTGGFEGLTDFKSEVKGQKLSKSQMKNRNRKARDKAAKALGTDDNTAKSDSSKPADDVVGARDGPVSDDETFANCSSTPRSVPKLLKELRPWEKYYCPPE